MHREGLPVATVAEHRPFFTGVVAATLLQSFLKRTGGPLTARERSVVHLIAERVWQPELSRSVVDVDSRDFH